MFFNIWRWFVRCKYKQIKSQYSRNKKVAIRLTENILSTKAINCIKYESLFTKSKKKDDLSDALLMTLHYLEKDIIKKTKIKEIDDSPLLKRKKIFSKKTELTEEIEKGQECITKL